MSSIVSISLNASLFPAMADRGSIVQVEIGYVISLMVNIGLVGTELI
ncbi:MAG: hypothetical protein HRF42_12225 [Candidatus Brocadia sp.]